MLTILNYHNISPVPPGMRMPLCVHARKAARRTRMDRVVRTVLRGANSLIFSAPGCVGGVARRFA